jgi:hypothetical protein
MSESQDTSEVAEKTAKEIGRLQGELARINSQEFPDGGILIAISSQLIAHHGLLSTILNGKMAAHMDKLVRYSETLTQQTDRLVEESIKLTKLTRTLRWLTVVLVLFAFFDFVEFVFRIVERFCQSH